jgi:hypothetical protein
MSRHISEEDIQMQIKPMKRCLAPLALSELLEQ